MYRAYYRIDIKAASPLSIGAAESLSTDHDVVTDGRGKPLIPATGLRGALRASMGEAEGDALFGTIENEARGTEQADSVVRMYDAEHIGGNEAISVRDSVRLKNKVAVDGLKFDRQIVEEGAEFRFYVEVLEKEVRLGDGHALDAAECIEAALGKLAGQAICLGAKTTRGMGRVEVTACERRTFDFNPATDADELQSWLGFDMFDDSSWTAADEGFDLKAGAGVGVRITLKLRLRGGLMVREYSTEPGESDFVQLRGRSRSGDSQEKLQPVIPATSWAGAFRERFEEFAGKDRADRLFGFVDEKSKKRRRSRITFSESKVEGGEPKRMTRNAIDRFTGGTLAGALFTQECHYGGDTTLVIDVAPGHEEDVDALAWVIRDLHNGLLPVGGMTAVGYGMFEVVKEDTKLTVNGKELVNFTDWLGLSEGEPEQTLADAIKDAMREQQGDDDGK